MSTKSLFRSMVRGSLGIVLLLVITGGPLAADDNGTCTGCCIYGCPDDCEFTSEFMIDGCRFQDKGINPYFFLKPGYRLVLETPAGQEERERSIETVLCETKWIRFEGRKIKTRILEERDLEWDQEEGKWVAVEISRNYFAICDRTNSVYFFGELSRECPEGFDENDVCQGEESTTGSWEAGVNGARPGLVMSGTPLLGSRYYQEMAPPGAVDRGEITAMGLDIDSKVGSWSGCIEIADTNPTEGICDDSDLKIYCPGVGLVQDQDLQLIWFGSVGCKDRKKAIPE